MRFFSILLFVFLNSTNVFSAVGSDWLISHANINGSINSPTSINHDYAATVETLITLDALGDSDRVEIANALQYLPSNLSEDSINLALTLLAQARVGIIDQQIINELETRVQVDGGFAPYQDYQSNVLDTIFALNALLVSRPESNLIADMVQHLKSAQQLDGGFKLKLDEKSSVYISSLASIILQLLKNQYDVNTELAAVTHYLLAQRNTTDISATDYQTWETNWQTALALLAIINENTDQSQYQEAIDKLNSTQLANGSWDNDVYTTALALRVQGIIAGTIFIPPANPSTILATVTDESNNQIIAAATVSINTTPTRSTQSTFNGEFSISDLNAGTYQLNISATGYQNLIFDINILDNQILELGNIKLFRKTDKGLLQGVITDAVTALPLVNASISITGNNTTTLFSNQQGHYNIELDTGDINIEISQAGYETINTSATIIAGQTLNFSPALSPAGTIPSTLTQLFGQVIHAQTSLPMENAEISITTGPAVFSDIDGLFNFTDLTPQAIEITVSKDGFNSIVINTSLIAGIMDLGQIRLSEIVPATTVTLSGIITDSQTNSPIAGVSVLNSSTGTIVQTDLNGFYQIENIIDLEFDLTATKANYFSKTSHISVSNFGVVEHSFGLTAIAPSDLTILSMISNRDIYYSNEEVEIEVILKNSGNTATATRLFIKVTNELGEILEDGPIIRVPIGGDLTDAITTVPANGQLELETPWFTRFFPAGDYTVTITAKKQGGVIIHDQKSIIITILPTKAVGGLVEFDPPVMQFDPNRFVNLSATISNTGNLPTGDFDITTKVFLTAKAENPPDQSLSSTVIPNPFTNDIVYGMEKTNDGMVLMAGSRTILQLNPATNVITEFATGFTSLRDISIDPNGLVYVIDISTRKITQLDNSGLILQEFNTGIILGKRIEALADNKILFMDRNNSLHELDAITGTVRTISKERLRSSSGIAVADNGDIFVVDTNSGSILVFDGTELSLFVEGLNQPQSIAIDLDGSVLVTERNAHQLLRIDVQGNIAVIAADITFPYDVKVTATGDYIVSYQDGIYQVSPDGTKVDITLKHLNKPALIDYNDMGTAYIYNLASSRVSAYYQDGRVELLNKQIPVGKDLIIDQNQDLLIMQSNEISKFNTVTGNYEIITTPESSFRHLSKANNANELSVIDGNKVKIINYLNNATLEQLYLPNEALINLQSTGQGVFALNQAGSFDTIDGNFNLHHDTNTFNIPSAFYIDQLGNKYVAEQNTKKVFKIDALNNVSEYTTLNNRAYAMIILADGRLIYSDSSSKLYITDGINEREYINLGFSQSRLVSMVVDDFGYLWVSSSIRARGVSKIEVSSGTVESILLQEDSVNINFLRAVETDKQGGIYVGGFGAIYHYDGTTTINVPMPAEIGNFYINKMTLHENKLWLHDDNNAILYIIDLNGNLIKKTAIIGGASAVLTSLTENIVSTNKHILSYSQTFGQLPDILTLGNYTDVQVYDANTLVLRNSRGEIIRLDKNTNEVTTILASKNPSAFAIYNTEIKSVATNNSIYEFDINGNILDTYIGITAPQGLAINESGTIFATTTFGLVKLREDGNGDYVGTSGSTSTYITARNGKIIMPRISSQFYIFDEVTGERTTLNFSPAFQTLKAIDIDANGDFILSSSLGIIKVTADGTASKLISSFNKVVDIESNSDGTVFIGVSQSGLSDIFTISTTTGAISNLPNQLDLPSALNSFSMIDSEMVLSFSRVQDPIVKVDNLGNLTHFPLAFSDNIIISNILAFDHQTIYGTEQRADRDRIMKLDIIDNNDTGLEIGTLVYTDTMVQNNLDVNSSPVSLDLGGLVLPISGSYSVELSSNNSEVSFNLSNTVSASALASGTIGLNKIELFPGDNVVETNIVLSAIDTKSVVEIRTDQITEITSSRIIYRNFIANDEGDFFGLVNAQVKKIDHITGVEETIFNQFTIRDIRINAIGEIHILSNNKIIQISTNGEILKNIEIPEGFRNFDIDQEGNLYGIGGRGNIYKLSSSNEWQLLLTWSGTVRFFEIGDTGKIYLSDGFNIHQVSEDGLVQRTVLKDFSMEFEGYNLEMMCFDNLIVAPITIDAFPSITGEEHTLIHLDPTFGLPRLIFDSDAIGLGIIDNDSMHYDSFNNRILLSTDSDRGMFSIPTFCGSMTVETHIITRPDVEISLNGDTPPPQSIIDNADGSQEYIWTFEDIGIDAGNLPLTANFNNLLEGETRPVFGQAYLQFKNTLIPEQDLQVALDIPTVHASSAKELGLVLDNSAYPSDTDVNINNTVINNSGVSFSGLISQHIETEQGVYVDNISDVFVTGLAPGESIALPALWNTAYYFTGTYKVVSQLLDENNIEQDRQAQTFTILPDQINGSIASLNVLADKQTYKSIDQVIVSTIVANLASNAILANSRAQVLLSQPDGMIIFQNISDVNNLSPQALQSAQHQIDFNNVVTGNYLVTLNLLDENDVIISSANSTFAVIRDDQQFMTGQVTALLPQVDTFTDNSCHYVLQNTDTVAINNIQVQQKVVNLITQEILINEVVNINLTGNQAWSSDQFIETFDLKTGIYGCILRTIIDGNEQTRGTAVFSLTGFNHLTGVIWDDANANGTQDGAEFTLANVQLQLLDSNQNIVEVISTSTDGSYQFTPIANGQYSIQVLETGVLDGYLLTTANNPMTVVLADNNTENNFGYQSHNSSINGFVFSDDNANGIRDVNEDIIENISIKLIDENGVEIATTSTDSSGDYSFTELLASSYQIQVSDELLLLNSADLTTANLPYQTTLLANEIDSNPVFGYQYHDSVMMGLVFDDINGDGFQNNNETGVANVSIELSTSNQMKTTLTDNNGLYQFNQLIAGTYQSTVTDVNGVLNGFQITTANQPLGIDLPNHANNNSGVFGYQAHLSNITGHVFKDDNGNGIKDNAETDYAGVTIELTGQNIAQQASTDSTGLYQFNQLATGNYIITVSDQNGILINTEITSSNQPYQLSLGTNQTDSSGNFAYQLHNSGIFGLVFTDTNGNGVKETSEAGLSDVSIDLVQANAVISSITTLIDGSYQFSQLIAGNYQVTVTDSTGVLSNNQITTNNQPYDTLLADNENQQGINFGYQLNNSEISGIVFDDTNQNGLFDQQEPLLSNVEVQLTDNSNQIIISQLTDINGHYSFAQLIAGSYQVEVTDNDLTGLWQNTSNNNPASLTLEQSSAQTIDFAFAQLDTVQLDSAILETNGRGRILVLLDQPGNYIDEETCEGLQAWTVTKYLDISDQLTEDSVITAHLYSNDGDLLESEEATVSTFEQLVDAASTHDNANLIIQSLNAQSITIKVTTTDIDEYATLLDDYFIGIQIDIDTKTSDDDCDDKSDDDCEDEECDDKSDDDCEDEECDDKSDDDCEDEECDDKSNDDCEDECDDNDDECTGDTWLSEPIEASCSIELDVGQHTGDFEITELIAAPKAITDEPFGPELAPTLQQQRSFLKNLLDQSGWFYTIVESAEDFETEFDTGQYVLYAIFSEKIKLPNSLQYEINDAFEAGEGLFIATGHDNRNKKLNEPMGIKIQGKHPSAESIVLEDSTLHEAIEEPLNLNEVVLKVKMVGATSVGLFTGTTGNSKTKNALSYVQYGQGKGVFAALDLLIQATHLESVSVYSELIVNSLLHIHNQMIADQMGKAQLVKLQLTNSGIALNGSVAFNLPADVSIVNSSLPHTQTDDLVNIAFEIAEEQTIEVSIWLVLTQSPETLTLNILDPENEIIDSHEITLTANEVQ